MVPVRPEYLLVKNELAKRCPSGCFIRPGANGYPKVCPLCGSDMEAVPSPAKGCQPMLMQMTYAEYAKIDAINFSTLKEMANGPERYIYRVKNPKEDNTQLACGRGAHTAVFEPDRFPLDYIIYQEGERRGNKWKDFKEKHKDQTILTLPEYQGCLRIRDKVRTHPVAKALMAKGTPEAAITWTDKLTGLACKARLDFVSDVLPRLLDLKTTGNANLVEFAKQMIRMLYHAQFAFYLDGLEAVGRPCEPVIVVAEDDEPHVVRVSTIDDDTIRLGRTKYQGWLRRVAECREKGLWVEDEGLETLRAPEWAFRADDSEEDVEMMDLIIPASVEA